MPQKSLRYLSQNLERHKISLQCLSHNMECINKIYKIELILVYLSIQQLLPTANKSIHYTFGYNYLF
jgi:hypothetical protein